MIAEVRGSTVYAFECYDVKDYLKAYNFRWDPDKRAWVKDLTNGTLRFLQQLGFEIVKPTPKEVSPELYRELKELYPKAFEHQIVGAGLALQERSFLLGDEPGVGKTFTGIIYLDYLLYKGLVKYGLVFCPASIKRQWQQEFHKWVGETALVLEGDPRQRKRFRKLFFHSRYPVLILNYELLLRKDVQEFLAQIAGESFAVVLDEASRVKSPTSKTFRVMKRLLAKTPYKLAMTGTPIENHLGEFWAIGHLLKGQEFMSQEEFEENHCKVIRIRVPYRPYYVPKVVGYKNLRKFLYRVEPFYIRRKKSDVKDMPELVEYEREIPASDIQKLIESRIIELASDKKGVEELATLQLLRVVADDPSLLLESSSPTAQLIAQEFGMYLQKISKVPKLEELETILEEHDSKVVVFTSFARMARKIAQHFGKQAIWLTGELSGDEKARRVGLFKSSDEKKILVATDTLTYGISMDEADVLVHFDIPWSVGKLIQRTDRIYRVTSTQGKSVYYLISEGTERKVWEILSSKRSLFSKVVEGEIMGGVKDEIIKALKGKAVRKTA